jgi:hypothetical protein
MSDRHPVACPEREADGPRHAVRMKGKAKIERDFAPSFALRLPTEEARLLSGVRQA